MQQFWADLMIEELVRLGVDYFCISPGSRSTPLTLAVASHKKTKSFVHFDERANAYHALGYAAAKKGGVAVITTSGTAVANLLPAVVEASKKKLPLILLTADRPVELRSTGANQTIDQVNIFGSYVRWNFDLCVPTEEIDPAFVLTTVDQAVHRSSGELPGPVHINCMFREPLYIQKKGSISKNYTQSLDRWTDSKSPFTEYMRANGVLPKKYCDDCADLINRSTSGMIVVGKLPDVASRNVVIKLAQKLNWPVFPDITSGLKLGHQSNHVITHFDQILENFEMKVDTVLHFGGRMTSKRYYQFVEQIKPSNYIMVLNHPLRNDPQHIVTHRVQCAIGEFCNVILPEIKNKSNKTHLTKLKNLDHAVSRFLENAFKQHKNINEPGVCRMITNLIPASHVLYVSSSLPIREMDMFADNKGAAVEVGANRGASGIDGTIASTVGYSIGSDKRATLVMGDLAFLYDLNSLSMLKDLKHPLIIILFNNDGGGIFEFFPVSELKNIYQKYFETPHGLTFQKAAELFGVGYAQPKTLNEFKSVYAGALGSRQSVIIEVLTDKKENHVFQKQLRQQIKQLAESSK